MEMDRLLSCKLCEKSNTIKVSFRKTIQIKPYEPEVFEVENELVFDRELTSIERDTIANILESTLEYGVLCHLYKKQYINKDEFALSKQSLELSSEAMLTKFEKITGKSRDTLINFE